MFEMHAEPLREPRIEFDQGEATKRAACDALAQDPEAGANLDNVVAGGEFGGSNDTVGDTGLDEEILPFRLERTYASDCERRGRAERADNRWRCFVAHRVSQSDRLPNGSLALREAKRRVAASWTGCSHSRDACAQRV